MEQIYASLREVLTSQPYKLVLSNGKDCQYQKIVVQQKGDWFQIEKYTQKQVFHENIAPEQLEQSLQELLTLGYRQLNSYSSSEQMELKISKKGKTLLNRRKQEEGTAAPAPTAHNKEKKLYFEGRHCDPTFGGSGYLHSGRPCGQIHVR